MYMNGIQKREKSIFKCSVERKRVKRTKMESVSPAACYVPCNVENQYQLCEGMHACISFEIHIITVYMFKIERYVFHFYIQYRSFRTFFFT